MISLHNYLKRLNDLGGEFSLAATAIQGFGQSQEALNQYAAGEAENIRHLFREANRISGTDPESGWIFEAERAESYMSSVISRTPERVDQVLPRLKQNEYLLQVAIFESFMKTAHRAILGAAPRLLKYDRKIDLGRLIMQDKPAILRTEIEREVNALDRESAEKKASYFRDRLHIDWSDAPYLGFFDRAVTVRNEILHEDIDRAIDEADMFAKDVTILIIPFATVAQGAVRYPTVFELPNNMTPGQIRELFRMGQDETDIAGTAALY